MAGVVAKLSHSSDVIGACTCICSTCNACMCVWLRPLWVQQCCYGSCLSIIIAKRISARQLIWVYMSAMRGVMSANADVTSGNVTCHV